MNRRDVLTRSGALAMAALAGCAGPQTGSEPTTTTTELPTSEPGVADEQLAALVEGNAGFALDIHKHLTTATHDNLFLSPYSISVALAMTYAGARGDTAAQMKETLRYTLGQDVHPAFADLQTALDSRETTEDPLEGEEISAFQLSVANALWGQAGYPFAQEYRSLVEKYYDGGFRTADFATNHESERERINDWVAANTGGRIEDLLPSGSLNPSTVMVLTNAIYFLAGWQFQFDPEDTEEATFTALDGSTSTVPLMQQNLRTNYASVEGTAVIELPYVGEEVSMVLILPEAGTFEQFEQSLTAEQLFGLFEALHDASGDIRLPRFEYETEATLSNVLAELGMPKAFEGEADFSGMVEGETSDLWIDEVYHQAFVSVDEEGTEAAAATAVVMEESAPSATFDLTFDRPFLFCIRDRPTDAVLFLGRVADAGDAQG